MLHRIIAQIGVCIKTIAKASCKRPSTGPVES
jgi:hypothetical protein